MTETRRAGRHTAAAATSATPPPDVEPDEVWVPPPFEPARPGDFVEYSSAGFEVRRSRRGLIVLLCLLLIAAAGGSWWYYQRSHAGTPLDPAQACQQEDAGAVAASSSFVHIRPGGRIPKGLPIPSEPAWVVCQSSTATGATGETAMWRATPQSGYDALLAAAGWIPSPFADGLTQWISSSSRHVIFTAMIKGHLVAFYRN